MQNSGYLILGGLCLLAYLIYSQPPLNKPAPPSAPVVVQAKPVEQTAQDYQQQTPTTAGPSPFTPPPKDEKHHSMDELLNPK